MKKLLKADLYSIFKSKLFIVSIILVIVYPLLMSLLYLGISNIVNVVVDGESMGVTFSAKSLFATSYSLSNDLGMVLPVFAADFILYDFRNGTLRNKIISGSTKSNIYLSHMICTAIFNFVMINLCSFFSLLFNSILLDGDFGFIANEMGYIAIIVGLGSLAFIFIGSITNLIAMSFKNIAPTLIFTIVSCVIFGLLGQLLVLLDVEKWGYILGIVPTYSASYLSTVGLENVKIGIIIEGALALIGFSIINIVLGNILFKKTDIK